MNKCEDTAHYQKCMYFWHYSYYYWVFLLSSDAHGVFWSRACFWQWPLRADTSVFIIVSSVTQYDNPVTSVGRDHRHPVTNRMPTYTCVTLFPCAPSELGSLAHRWVNAGPASATLARHWSNDGGVLLCFLVRPFQISFILNGRHCLSRWPLQPIIVDHSVWNSAYCGGSFGLAVDS